MFDKLRVEFRRQVPFAASRAINEMAFETREMLKSQMDRYYDGGAVRYTKNAVYSSRSTKRNLYATVFIGGNDEHRIRYILNTIDGGRATPRKKVLTEPVDKKLRLTKLGHNIPRGAIQRIAKKPGYFIFPQPGTKQSGGNMQPGLYRRTKGRKIELIVAFHESKAHKAVFPARSLSAAFVKRHFNSILYRNLRGAIRTMK